MRIYAPVAAKATPQNGATLWNSVIRVEMPDGIAGFISLLLILVVPGRMSEHFLRIRGCFGAKRRPFVSILNDSRQASSETRHCRVCTR
jgi:hypothetical protein